MPPELNRYTVGTKGEPITLLHGWGFHGGIWKESAEALANRHTVTAIDLPGHGRSAMPNGDYTLSSLADGVAESLPVHGTLIGWSLGGMVAMQIALTHPEKIRRLILVGSVPRFVRDDDWHFAISAEILQEFSDSLAKDLQQTLHRFAALQVMGSGESRALLQKLRDVIDSSKAPRTAALHGGLQILQHTDLRARLNEIRQPTLMIFGKRDTLSRPQTAEQMVTLLPDARLEIINGAGHAPFLSHQQEFTSLIEQFIKEP